MMSGTQPINSTTPKICPFGYRRDPASGQCVKTISSVDRLTASQPAGASPQIMPDSRYLDGKYWTGMSDGGAGVSDGLLPIYGTVGTIANTVLSVAVVLGAIGGIVYIVKNKPFSRRKK